jgi:hypothetical protein
MCVCRHTRVSQKVTGLLKKHIYCKYTETNLILLFNVIPLDFNAPVPAFHIFFKFLQKKKFLIVSLKAILHLANDFFIGWKSSSS